MPRHEPRYSPFRLRAVPYTRDAAQILDEYGRKVATVYRVNNAEPIDIAKRIVETIWMPVTDATRAKAEELADTDVVAIAEKALAAEVAAAEADTLAVEPADGDEPFVPSSKPKKMPKWVKQAAREAASKVGS